MKTELISRNSLQSLTLGATESIAEVGLRAQELLKTRTNGQKLNIYVTCGNLWVTQEGDPNDHLVKAGEAFVADHKGMVVMQGMADVRMRISRH